MSLSFVRRIAITTLALPLLLGGCADDEPVPKTPATSVPTSTATETPTEPVEPTLPPEAEGDGPEAAEAFVRHYYAMVNYAQATGDTAALSDLGLRSCEACEGGLQFIQKIYNRGGKNVGGDYSVVSTEVDGRRRVSKTVSYFTLSVVTSHTHQEVSGAGDMDRIYEPGKSTLSFEVVRDPTGWHVTSWDNA